jgi:hypothetical protein
LLFIIEFSQWANSIPVEIVYLPEPAFADRESSGNKEQKQKK